RKLRCVHSRHSREPSAPPLDRRTNGGIGVGYIPRVAFGVDEGAGPLFGGVAGAGLSGVRELPWGRRTGGSPGSPMAPLPPARGALPSPGCARRAGDE